MISSISLPVGNPFSFGLFCGPSRQLPFICFMFQAQSRPGYQGPMIWPRKNEANVRTFSEEQIQAGKQVISLQYGSNKGASQAGMNFGKTRMILD